MATKNRSSSAPIIIREASPVRRRASATARRVGAAIKKHGRRASVAGAKAAWKRRALIGAAVVGAGMGYIQRNNIDIPSFGPLGKNGTIAAALVAATMAVRNEWLDHAAAGAVAVAGYDWQSTGSIHGMGAGVGNRFQQMHNVIDAAARR